MASIGRIVSLNLVAIIVFAILYFLLARMGAADFTGLSKTSTPLDALYFSSTIQSSVGFGDISPMSGRAKLLVMLQQFVLIIGIVDLMSSGGVSSVVKNVVKPKVNAAAVAAPSPTVSSAISGTSIA
jgi:hypothetical protein